MRCVRRRRCRPGDGSQYGDQRRQAGSAIGEDGGEAIQALCASCVGESLVEPRQGQVAHIGPAVHPDAGPRRQRPRFGERALDPLLRGAQSLGLLLGAPGLPGAEPRQQRWNQHQAKQQPSRMDRALHSALAAQLLQVALGVGGWM